MSFLEDAVAVGHPEGEEEVYVGAGQQEVAVFGANGKLQHAWTGASTANQSFRAHGLLASVAVDGSGSIETGGDVYVAVNGEEGFPSFNVVDVFKPTAGGQEPPEVVGAASGGGEITGTTSGPFVNPTGVAVSGFNGDVLVADGSPEACRRGEGECVVDVFEPVPGMPGQYLFLFKIPPPPQGPFTAIGRMAVDKSNGNIYLVEQQLNVVDEFSKEGKYLGRLTGTPAGPFKAVASVAVDPETPHRVFVGDFNTATQTGSVDVYGEDVVIPAVETLAASSVTPGAAQLNGTIDPEGAGAASCQFVWGESEALGSKTDCPTVPSGEANVPVSATLTGLAPDTRYFYRLQAGNANGTNTGEEALSECEGKPSVDACFTTSGPGIHGVWSSEVSSTSATLNAKVDPHGNATEVFFEYGPTAGYGARAPVPPATIGSGAEAQAEAHVQALTAGTLYHYRAVVVNELGEFPSPDHTFTTEGPGGGLALPDGRRWELVSPPDKHGAKLEPIVEEGVVQASSSGGAISYRATVPTEAGVAGYSLWDQVLSSRGAGGWSSKDISTAQSSATGPLLSIGGEYRFFSEDLSLALVEPQGEFTSLASESSPPDSERTPYVRHDTTCAAAPAGCFQPLLTSAPGYADVPSGTEFGGPPMTAGGPAVGNANFVGATPDLAHVILTSKVALTSTPTTGNLLYEWSAGRPPGEELALVSVLPGGQPANTITVLGHENEVARHAVSDDGSRVVWSERSGTSTCATWPRNSRSSSTCRKPDAKATQANAAAARPNPSSSSPPMTSQGCSSPTVRG